ncbi:MAG: FAD-dependent monooxygenase, partial [Pseudomonadota bacterium]
RRALEAIDLDLSADFTFPKRIEIHAGDRTAPLASYTLGSNFKHGFGAEYSVMSRADLQMGLWRACAAHARIQMAPGQTAAQSPDVDLIVGADGVRSTTRSLVPGARQTASSGYVACRSVVDMEAIKAAGIPLDAVSLWLGKNAHAVIYPLPGNTVNIVLSTKGTVSGSGWSVAAPARLIGSILNKLDRKLSILQEAAQFSQWNIDTVPASSKWHLGRIALVGDAAHAMPPFAAQGSAMALEDAIVLAAELENHTSIEGGLQAFAQSRMPRVAKVAQLSHANAKLYHMSGPLAAARDLTLKATPQAVINARMAWIYDWTPPELPLG